MTTQLTIFFDTPAVRRQFLSDVQGLIVYHDENHRDEDQRMNYEEALSFYMPDLDQGNPDQVVSPCQRISLLRAEMETNPSHYYHFIGKTV
jgi:hypothetical protein